jgi:hypothetical protein
VFYIELGYFIDSIDLKVTNIKNHLDSVMLRATNNNMESGMWNLECGVMYRREK